MTTFAPEVDALEALVRRPFIVLDTETTWVPDGNPQRLVSIGWTYLLGGIPRAARSGYLVINPDVPIVEKSTAIHGFTKDDLDTADPFTAHAAALHALLSTPRAVLVAHNASYDIAILRNELALAGMALPDLPVIDTMYLPKTVGFTNDALPSTPPGLVLLTKLLLAAPLREDDHHHSGQDAAATADVLMALLRHAASNGTATDIDQLLAVHAQGTTHQSTGTGYIGSRDSWTYTVDPAHVATHNRQLPTIATTADINAWLDRADECTALLCPLLIDEAVAVTRLDTTLLFGPLTRTLATLTEPGQAATLIGAAMRMIQPTRSPRQEASWWGRHRAVILAAPRCAGAWSCPDCREGRPCPLDVAHEYAGASLARHSAGQLTSKRIDYIARDENGGLATWASTASEAGGHAAYLGVRHYLLTREPSRAAQVHERACALGLHQVDPRLAVRTAEQWLGQGRDTEARALLVKVSRPSSSNPAQRAVTQALARLDANTARKAAKAEAAATHTPDPVRSRPATRVRPNPYRLNGQ